MMLTGEHGLAAVEPRPVLAAIATFVVFVICGLIPLLPFLAGSSNAYLIAVASTTITFLVIGAMKSKWSTEHWLTSALQTLAIGGSAVVIAYVAGNLVAA